MAERVGFEPLVKRRFNNLQHTGSDLRHCECMKSREAGFSGVSRGFSFLWAEPPHSALGVASNFTARERLSHRTQNWVDACNGDITSIKRDACWSSALPARWHARALPAVRSSLRIHPPTTGSALAYRC